MKIINKLVKNFFGKTPKTAKKILITLTALVGSAAALWAAHRLGELSLDPIVLGICKYTTIIGTALGVVAQGQGEK